MRPVAIALLLAFTLIASAQEAVVLKRIAKAGDTWKYRMQALTTLETKPATFTSLLTETVKAVDAEKGTITIESVSTQNEVKFNEKTSTPPESTTTTIVSGNGAVATIVTGAEDPNLYRLANLNSLQFGKTAVKIGDTWTIDVAADDRGTVAATGSYKIEATEKVGEIDTWRISGTFKETSGDKPASIDAIYWVDPKDGSIVKMTGNLTNAPFPDLPPLTVKISLTREK